MKGIAQAAQSQTTAQQKAATNQFYTIGRQISLLANDTSYQGLNLLNTSTSTLNVVFSEKSNSSFIQTGFHLNSTVNTGTNLSLGLFTNNIGAFAGTNAVFGAKGTTFNARYIFGGNAAAGALQTFTAFGSYSSGILVNTGSSRFQATVTVIDNAINQLRAISATLGSNVALLKTRSAFTSDYIVTIQGGSSKLTLADLNEEGANLVSLQTRQSLGIQSLSFAGQSQQGILKLFG